MLDFNNLLSRLCLVPSVSSREDRAHAFFKELCAPYFDEVLCDRFGNVIAKKLCGKKGAKKLMLDAHLDEIGLVVTEICDGGFVKVAPIGGVDTGILPAMELILYGKETIRGIVAAAPPHLIPADKRGKKQEMSSVLVDTGYSRESLEKIISPGDLIGFDTKFTELLNNRAASKGMDDRACGLCLIGAVELVCGKDIDYDIYVTLSIREETGALGAVMAAYSVEPDFAIVVDVDHARLPGDTEKARDLIGEGASITYTDTLCRHLSDALVNSSKNARLPIQVIADTGHTGTNAHEMAVSAGGIPCVVLSLPLKNMHTPVELCDISDMESVANVIAAFITDGTYKGEGEILFDRT
ncbi:putative aminopeptidase YsdC [bioreactor metagenome]|uniref:Putative aminopeptidase YsdC n=1 Tax=bioreactor metagenome TaxID=1076179 RepID=A0A645CH49_9ZZZZ|nr:hypothetical protein [Oscillospiraceae bacterium]